MNNMTQEDLTFFIRAQRLAASTDAIAFNFALCGQILAVISAMLIGLNNNLDHPSLSHLQQLVQEVAM